MLLLPAPVREDDRGVRAQLRFLRRTRDLAAMARWGWAPALVRRVPLPAGGSRTVFASADGTFVRDFDD